MTSYWEKIIQESLQQLDQNFVNDIVQKIFLDDIKEDWEEKKVRVITKPNSKDLLSSEILNFLESRISKKYEIQIHNLHDRLVILFLDVQFQNTYIPEEKNGSKE